MLSFEHLDLPTLLLGLILLAYWTQVLRMVARAKRHSRPAANLIPAERIGRVVRIIWLPVVVAWISQPLLSAFRWHRGPGLLQPLVDIPLPVRCCAVMLAAGCWLATIRCWKQMGKAWRMGIDPAERTSLVVTGAFARVRHPIYALSQILMLASVVVVPSPLLLIAAVLHILLLHWESRREETHLLRIHGDAYAEYCARVSSFIPRWS